MPAAGRLQPVLAVDQDVAAVAVGADDQRLRRTPEPADLRGVLLFLPGGHLVGL
jgi:hypothetical protein